MQNLPLVSVLCLCYNQEKYIVESLESIKAQSYKNLELLICDDFSKDNSVGVIENWIQKNPEIDITFVKHSENRGITKSLNEILHLSKGKYIQQLALDDILMPDKLERHVEMLEKSPENAVLVFTDANLIDDKSARFQNKFIARHLNYLSLTSQNYYEMLLEKNFIPAMSVLLKREIILSVGSYDESLSCEDHDMWLRLSRDYDFLFDDVISCSYRLHGNNSHKKRDILNVSLFFRTMIKHKDHPSARHLIFEHLEKLYLLKALTDEHKIFYDYYPVKSFPEKLIKNNLPPVLYRIALLVNKTLAFVKDPY